MHYIKERTLARVAGPMCHATDPRTRKGSIAKARAQQADRHSPEGRIDQPRSKAISRRRGRYLDAEMKMLRFPGGRRSAPTRRF